MKKKIPEIYCSISVSFSNDIDIQPIIFELNKIGILDIQIVTPKCEPIVNLDFAIIYYESFWYLSEALTKMFSKIDYCIVELKNIITTYNGKFSIDIAFYQYGTYPALEFEGENMKKIRFLEADISIDPY